MDENAEKTINTSACICIHLEKYSAIMKNSSQKKVDELHKSRGGYFTEFKAAVIVTPHILLRYILLRL